MATQTELADFLGLSTRRVRELQAAGIIPPPGRDGRDVRAAVRAYADHLREIAAGRSTDRGELDLIQERARLAKEQADRVALQNARARGDLVPIADVARIVSGEYTAVRQLLLSLPARLAQQLAIESDAAAVERALKDGVAECLSELSDPETVAAKSAAEP